MAVTQMTRIGLSDFAECLAHLIEQIDPYILLPVLTYGNPIIAPGSLIIRGFFDNNINELQLYTLNYDIIRIDLQPCIDYYDTDGLAEYILGIDTLEITTNGQDTFIIKFE